VGIQLEEVEVFHRAYLVVKKFVIYLAVILVINLIVALLGGSLGITLTAIMVALYLSEGLIIYYIIKKVIAGKAPGKAVSQIMLMIDIILLVVFGIFLYTAYQMLSKAKMVAYPYASFFTPIVTICLAGYFSPKIEDALREYIPYLGRRLGDALRMLIVVGSLAVGGVIINLFTVYWFDPGMAILIALVGIRESLLRALMTFRGLSKKEEMENIVEGLRKIFLELPSVVEVRDAWATRFGYYCYGGCKVILSPLVHEELSEIKRYLIKRTVHAISFIIAIDLKVEKADKGIVKVAVPVSDSNVVGSFDETNRFVLVSVEFPEIKIKETDTIDIAVSKHKIIPAQKAKELALRKTEVVLLKDASDLALNELRGWFIKVCHPRSEDIEEAVKECLAVFKK